jgi:hypothetical protein
MRFIRILPLLLILYTADLPVEGQAGPLKGKIVDGVTRKPVEYGIVLNYSRHINMYSNPAGEFILQAAAGDTLVLSAVGYYFQKIIVTDSLLQASMPIQFSIRPRAYEITEARIVPLGTYEEFRQRFVNMDRAKSRTELLTDRLTEWSHEAAKEGYEKYRQNRIHDGITLLTVPIRSRDERERIALTKIMESEKVRDLIYQKFNPDVITKVTGITADHEIIEFMVFCDFSDQYLLDISAYDLMTQIALKYDLFKRRKQLEQSGQKPVNLNHDLSNPNV